MRSMDQERANTPHCRSAAHTAGYTLIVTMAAVVLLGGQALAADTR